LACAYSFSGGKLENSNSLRTQPRIKRGSDKVAYTKLLKTRTFITIFMTYFSYNYWVSLQLTPTRLFVCNYWWRSSSLCTNKCTMCTWSNIICVWYVTLCFRREHRLKRVDVHLFVNEKKKWKIGRHAVGVF